MDESAISFHTPETKQKSKQWLPKGTPRQIKARIHASRKKQMVVSFFDNKDLIYHHYVELGAKVIFRHKRPEIAAGKWFLHWDNAQCIL